MAEERVQRRLAAILAADMVGYSRLMGEDETGTLAALNSPLTKSSLDEVGLGSKSLVGARVTNQAYR